MKRSKKKDSTPEVNAFVGNRMKSAVAAAAACSDKHEGLPNQPIILRCRSDKATFDHAVAYWPSDAETGEKLLILLDRLLDKDDKDDHVRLVCMITNKARNRSTKTTSDDRGIYKLLKEATGGDALDELGIFSLMRPDVFSHEKEKKICANTSLFITDYSQLSPYLYHHQCIAYWYIV